VASTLRTTPASLLTTAFASLLKLLLPPAALLRVLPPAVRILLPGDASCGWLTTAAAAADDTVEAGVAAAPAAALLPFSLDTRACGHHAGTAMHTHGVHMSWLHWHEHNATTQRRHAHTVLERQIPQLSAPACTGTLTMTPASSSPTCIAHRQLRPRKAHMHSMLPLLYDHGGLIC
jgi:hypothetical protein